VRLGLFGGTFNPIHYGHLRSAEEVCENLSLDRLLLIPAARPPHKQSESIIPFSARLEMTRLAVSENPRFDVSEIEGQRSGKSYSIETIRQFRQNYTDAEIYFILGLDALLEINTWKDYQQLFNLCHFVVLDRPGYEWRQLEDVLRLKVNPHCRRDESARSFRHPSGNQIFLSQATLLEISSTRIRQLVSEGKSIRYLLPDAVRRYILKEKYYQVNSQFLPDPTKNEN
jgi:nicotinate-nucleotide adenylyltransferase